MIITLTFNTALTNNIPGEPQISNFDTSKIDTRIPICTSPPITQTVSIEARKRLTLSTVQLRAVSLAFVQTNYSGISDVTCSVFAGDITATESTGGIAVEPLAAETETVNALGYTETITPLEETFIFTSPILIEEDSTFTLQVEVLDLGVGKKTQSTECVDLLAISDDTYPFGQLKIGGQDQLGDLAFNLFLDIGLYFIFIYIYGWLYKETS